MKNIKYFFNTHTLRYEKLVTPFRVKLLKFFAFFAAIILTAIIIVVVAFRYIDSPKERMLTEENADLKENYNIIDRQLEQLNQKMTDLEEKDNDIYRSIFEAAPVPDSARLKQMEKNKELQLITGMSENNLVKNISEQLNNLTMREAYQLKSYSEINNMINNKEKLLQAIPSIQPVSNTTLKRIASGFGSRIDPVYKITKFHAGLDFTAPIGTPIYATADGVVTEAGFNDGGYGNRVIINHGYGYETLYAHMFRIKTRAGKKVMRGEVIGYVGSTGKSTGPHCHYEVHKNQQPVDPIYYFYNDLTPEQYDRVLKLSSANNQSFD